MTPEGKVKKAVRELLKSRGAYQFWPVVGKYGKKGVDAYVCYRGCFLAIETKQLGEKPTTNQQNTLNEVSLAYGYTVVEDRVDCSNLLSCLAVIDRWREEIASMAS